MPATLSPASPLTLHEIRRLDDPLLLPWLALWETSFPPEERELAAEILAAVAARPDQDRGPHLLAATGEEDEFTGLVYYILHAGPQGLAAVLAYFATAPERRNQGLGARLYRAVRDRLTALGALAVILEVEIPERAEDEARAELAARRIAFYRRLGCRRLAGVSYRQYVGDHVAPIPMHLLVDAPPSLSAAEAVALAGQCFGPWLTVTGEAEYD
ncbi:MAG TPA: GNAT family N-acetyltransferase [Anaerolineae bacterium]